MKNLTRPFLSSLIISRTIIRIEEKNIFIVGNITPTLGMKKINLRYEELPFYLENSRPWIQFLRKFITYNSLSDNSILLDLGCGYADLNKLIHINRKNIGYIGIDGDLDSLKEAYNKNPNSIYLQSNLELLIPIIDTCVDFVSFEETLEHLHKEVNIFEEINRILKPKGTLLFSAPIAKNEKERIEERCGHIWVRTYEEMEKEILKFFDIEFKYFISECKNTLFSLLPQSIINAEQSWFGRLADANAVYIKAIKR